MARINDSWLSAAHLPVSGASSAAFRIAFGLMGLAGVIRFWVKGWIEELYLQPRFHFTYFGFDWVRPWPDQFMYLHFAALGAACIGIAAGFRYRFSVALFCLLFTYVELLDKTLYLNHYYLVSLLSCLMLFMPLHRRASLDSLLRPEMRSPTVPAWVVWVLRAQLGAVYFFAGLAKLNPDWLAHGLPLRIWLYSFRDLPTLGAMLRQPWFALAVSWAGAFFDLTILGWLSWIRSRPCAYAALLAFHVLTWLLFPRIGLFPWIMIGNSLIFLAPDWPERLWSAARRLLPRLPVLRARRDPRRGEQAGEPLWVRRSLLAGIAMFALIQVSLPLRHWLFPGDVRWNEEGYYFSWRVMLTEKAGAVEFRVKDPVDGRTWRVSPDEYLTPVQVERMAVQPEMILQTAHHIARDFNERGYAHVQVYADAFVTFNGRPFARLIDAEADLAAIPESLAPRPWVLPFKATAELPPP